MREIISVPDLARFLTSCQTGLLYVYGPWWPPRSRVNTLLEQLSCTPDENVGVAKMNADENSELCARLGVTSIPELLVFQEGCEVERLRGDGITSEQVNLTLAAKTASTAAPLRGVTRGGSRGRRAQVDDDVLFANSVPPPHWVATGFLFCEFKKLNFEQARWLAQRQEDLLLDDLRLISPPVAYELATHRGRLSLDGVKQLELDAAIAFHRFQGLELHLNGLKSLNAVTASALAGCQGLLSLNGLKRLSTAAAGELSRHTRALALDGLSRLPAEVAAPWAECRASDLSLCGLSTLSAEAAHCLAQYAGGLKMTGLSNLSIEATDELRAARGRLHLRDNPELSHYARHRLRQFFQ